jgi:adenylate kinase family enzyme
MNGPGQPPPAAVLANRGPAPLNACLHRFGVRGVALRRLVRELEPEHTVFRVSSNMKVILLGNAGSGKSTLARRMIARHPAARLSLDEVAFESGTERRPLQQSIDDVVRWIAANESWIIEGCYADIIEPVLKFCDQLIFLNPGIEACIAHCRSRPWELEKFSSRQEQDANLDHLIRWVSSYETRSDEYGLSRHRALYDSFPGRKLEFNHPSQYESMPRCSTLKADQAP